ncbi:MAG: heme o synthase [Patescibacteria group bacterium]|jgi:protoheme IX farnesyltransferase
MSIPAKVAVYYGLTKPGIIKGNLLATLAGFLLASAGEISTPLLIWTILGTSLVIGGACALNNVLDVEFDKLMTRTKQRVVVTGKISAKSANIFGFSLTLVGLLCLVVFVNTLTATIGLIGWVFYVYVYAYAKRNTIYSTLIGGISGATPPVAGYVAVTNNLDFVAFCLFLILTCWQIPHFYAISIFRYKEYKNTALPLYVLKRGISATKLQIMLFCVLLVLFYPALFLIGATGWVYLFVMGIMSLQWLQSSLQGLRAKDDTIWAKHQFKLSIRYLSVFCLILMTEFLLP